MANVLTKITHPGVYRQMESLDLSTITCECGCVVWGAGMNTNEGHIQFSCLSCGLTSSKMYVTKEQAEGAGKLHVQTPPEVQ